MASIGDGSDDGTGPALPESVDRILGQLVPPREDGRTVLDSTVVDDLKRYLAKPDTDSNIDRLPLNREMDLLIDGNKAVAAFVSALEERFRILPGEPLYVLQTR